MPDKPARPAGKAPPPKARLYWSSLTATEKAVLDAMYEHCSDGSIVWASLPRLAAYSKLSRKTVQRVLHGDKREGTSTDRPGLIARGVVSQLARASARKRQPATYRINAEAMAEDPSMDRFKKRQMTLPGIRRPAAPGEPVEVPADAAEIPVQIAQTDSDPTVPRSIGLRTVGPEGYGPTVHRATDRRSTNSLDLDSDVDSLRKIQHAEGALTVHSWLAIKEILRKELSPGEWDLWVRPARFLRAMDGKTMQIAVPPNGRIQAAAVARKELLNEVTGRVGLRAVLTTYPDEWQREQLEKRYPSIGSATGK